MTPGERALLVRIRLLEKKLASAGGGGSLVPTSRQVISGGGLTGGGDLSTDRTLAVGAGTGITVNADDIAVNQSVLKLDDFAATDDNTDLDASTTKHGLMPKWTAALISALLDLISTTRGAILYRGAAAWSALNPGTSGDVLTSNGTGADPSYQTPSGGSGITQLTGDVTAGPGSGSQTATIPNDTVTNAKAANMAEATVKGRAAAAGTGDPTDLTANQASTILDSATDPFLRTSALGTALAALTATVGATFTGDDIAVGVKRIIRVPHGFDPLTWVVYSDATISIVIDIWADTLANYPPADADTITGGNEPEIVSALIDDGDASAFDPLAAGDFVTFNIDSVTPGSATWVTIQLIGTRT